MPRQDKPIKEPFVGEYKGNKTLTIPRYENDEYGFSFGITKAKAILAHIKAIEAFVDQYGKETTEG